LSLLLFARHVYLDAQGMIAAKPARARKPKTARKQRAVKQPALRVVADDLGETVTEAPEPEVVRVKTKSNSAAEDAADEEDEPVTRRKSSKRSTRTKTISLASRSSQPTREEPDPPQVVKVPSISRTSSAEPADAEADELARLEATEPHLLTKAQRRRLKKLQRRGGRKAA
jgi:hypothetical protein